MFPRLSSHIFDRLERETGIVFVSSCQRPNEDLFIIRIRLPPGSAQPEAPLGKRAYYRSSSDGWIDLYMRLSPKTPPMTKSKKQK